MKASWTQSCQCHHWRYALRNPEKHINYTHLVEPKTDNGNLPYNLRYPRFPVSTARECSCVWRFCCLPPCFAHFIFLCIGVMSTFHAWLQEFGALKSIFGDDFCRPWERTFEAQM
eukprot:2625922-Amphidinium_carterae.1